MKAIILAAGGGWRLRPLTASKPKCLVEVAGKPILEHQIEAFGDSGIKEIYIIAGYRIQDIKKFMEKYKSLKIRILENKEYETTNNMYSLWLAKDVLNGRKFILCNGDVVFDRSILDRLMSSETYGGRVVCEKGQYDEEAMKITVGEAGFINNISKKIGKEAAFGNSIDLYYFSEPSASLLFEEIGRIIETEKNVKEWTEVALQRLFNTLRLKMKPFELEGGEKWAEIDTMEDLLLAEEKFSKKGTFLRKKKLFFIDLDGTVYLGDQLINGAKEFIEELRSRKKKYYFLSNNSSKSKKDYVKNLYSMGIFAQEENIILSTDGALNFLKREGIKDVFLVGTKSMEREFVSQGFRVSFSRAQWVVLGYDTELNYDKICKATLLLNKGIPFIATHSDLVCPTKEGLVPDAGSMIKLLKASTGVSPKIFGKPKKAMIEHVIRKERIQREDIVLIGDRLYTEGKLAQNSGIDFICVLTGETKMEDVVNNKGFMVVKDIGELVNYL